jgi:hypothetical protein
MAKKISQLTQATQVKSDDVTVIVQDGETKKLPLNTLVTKQDIENKKVAGLAKLDEIEATYENDTYTPTITVKNKSSVKTGEGDGVDYSANVMDGHAKSAILTGQTLVNLNNYNVGYKNFSEVNGTEITLTNNGTNLPFINLMTSYTLKPNTKYTVIFDIVNNPLGLGVVFYHQKNATIASTVKSSGANQTGLFKFTIETNERESDCLRIVPNSTSAADNTKIKNIVILEGDYADQNIPYFEGMTSVKMPVLTTTGKNLFDGKLIEGKYQNLNGSFSITDLNNNYITDFIEVNGGETITVSGFQGGAWYDANKNPITNDCFYGSPSTKTLPINAKYLVMNVSNHLNDLQIEYGSIATPYEPYKSNILTVNEDITLRGIGDVQDELDLETGKLSQRIGEVVLDGSEDWVSGNNANWDNNGNTMGFYFDFKNSKNNSCYSDKLPLITNIQTADTEGIYIASKSSWIGIRVLKTKLNGLTTVDELKIWLQQNPITIQYQLATESIKTVDLIPSGTHPSTTPYCWKNGHIQLSSSGLLPSLEYSVVTSRAGQISQNAAMIVKNDKRIFDLEILLAGGLVNTTYQALTLQNQVETGLSKVSLSSEKEPDYLLYHMIMKLIEEKAYKLDDLAEKVSVFYLYEKLSDEQFETIYSELYPFVEEEYIELPEDGEIIEEPIVDEALEEVENEVVM